MKRFLILVCIALSISLSACEAQKAPQQGVGVTHPDTARYQYAAANRDGIGKTYMGREISYVMGHQGAEWLERPERATEERPDLILQHMDLAPDAVVADIGAGTGYFSFPISRLVPEGKVLAVDIQQEMLDLIAQKQAAGMGENIQTVLGTETNPGLDSGQVDAVLIVDVYHEMAWPYETMQGIVRAMKPGGRLFLVEYRAEDPAVPIKRLHKMTEAQARAEMERVGLRFVANQDFLPRQHFLIFQKD
jgi:SAM-dependent methyltransferase